MYVEVHFVTEESGSGPPKAVSPRIRTFTVRIAAGAAGFGGVDPAPVCACADAGIRARPGRRVAGSGPGSCPPTSFQCRTSGFCVPLLWRCDSDRDCRDGSDEEECRIEPCAQNGQCPPPPGLACSCDGDCPGGTDQSPRNCSRPPCPDGELRCVLSNDCVPHTWRCDGHPDCPDSSDELGCETNETLQEGNTTTIGTSVAPESVTSPRNASNTSVADQSGIPSAYGVIAAAALLSTSLVAITLFGMSQLRAQGHLPRLGLLVALKESLLLSERKTSLV
ncbi:CD320 antigen [Carlito syrichta]|uniref:CD320 antigen n=1 Tax=Carlito syrichta TaxID=1868482 RepID=A0A1U7UA46_CARSF|nr:CD320 antigen [Carlito syrichta]